MFDSRMMSMGLENGSESETESLHEMADPPKAKRFTLTNFLQPEVSTSSASSEESCFAANSEQSLCTKSSNNFFSEGTVSRAATFNPAKNFLASSSPWTLTPCLQSQFPVEMPLPDGKSNRCLATMVRKGGHVYSLAVSGDGLLYTGSESKNIRVWKQSSFDEYGCLKAGSGSVKALLVARNYVFSAHDDRNIRVWYRPRKDLSACKRLGTLPTLKDQIRSSMNPKNYIVRIRRHNKAFWGKHVDAISSMAFNEERGLLYSGSWDKTVKVWRLRDWKCVESIVAHDDAVSSVAVAVDGLLFTGSADGTVKVWAPIPEKGMADVKYVLTQTLRVQQSAAVHALAHTVDGVILYSGSADGSVNVWEREMPIYMNSMQLQHAGTLRGHRVAVLCLATVKNLLFSGSADKSIHIWRRDSNGSSHSRLGVLQGHTGPVKCIAATDDTSNSDGILVYSGSLDQSVKVWWVCNNYSLNPNADLDSTYYPVLSPAWVQQRQGY